MMFLAHFSSCFRFEISKARRRMDRMLLACEPPSRSACPSCMSRFWSSMAATSLGTWLSDVLQAMISQQSSFMHTIWPCRMGTIMSWRMMQSGHATKTALPIEEFPHGLALGDGILNAISIDPCLGTHHGIIHGELDIRLVFGNHPF
jgi:hypothetical protein